MQGDESKWVLAQGLSALAVSQGYAGDYARLFAGLTIAMLPVLAVYVVFQRQVQCGPDRRPAQVISPTDARFSLPSPVRFRSQVDGPLAAAAVSGVWQMTRAAQAAPLVASGG